MQVTDFIIRSNEALNDRNRLIKVTPADHRHLPPMQPGQFVQVLVDRSPGTFLRRPISINFVDREKNELWLLVQEVGDGTREICRRQPGEMMNIIYPLGNSFTLPEGKGERVGELLGKNVVLEKSMRRLVKRKTAMEIAASSL